MNQKLGIYIAAGVAIGAILGSVRGAANNNTLLGVWSGALAEHISAGLQAQLPWKEKGGNKYKHEIAGGSRIAALRNPFDDNQSVRKL